MYIAYIAKMNPVNSPTADTAVVPIDIPLLDLSLIPLMPETKPPMQIIVHTKRSNTIVHALERLLSLITIAEHEKKKTNSRIKQRIERTNILFSWLINFILLFY